MASAVSRMVSGWITRLAATGPEAEAELLHRYATAGDQQAFAALVERFAPLVWGVCSRALKSPQDAEDAFQATFLALSKQAEHLTDRGPLGAWLHLVARRSAALVHRKNQRRREVPVDNIPLPSAAPDDRELAAALDEEVARLPEKYRRPVVLCHLQNQTYAEAARALGVSVPTVCRRVTQGCEMLRGRLTKRGYAPAGGLAVLFGLMAKPSAAMPFGLIGRTVQAVGAGTAGASAAIADAVLGSMGWAKPLKLIGLAAAVTTLGAGGVRFVPQVFGSVGTAESAQAIVQPMPAGVNNQFGIDELPVPVSVVGRVLDDAGQPVPQARVALLTGHPVRGEFGRRDELIRHGQADADGRFALEVPADVLMRQPDRPEVKLVAAAPGLAMAAVTVSVRPGSPPAEVRLAAADAVRGRVLDADDRPAGGVAVHVVRVGAVGREPVQGGTEPVAGPLPWPEPVVTDADGRFEFADLDPRQGLGLEVRDDRFAPQRAALDVRNADADLTLRVAPPQVFEGQVRAADTGRPLAHARLSIAPCEPLQDVPGRPEFLDARADAEGRFRVRPLPGRAFKVYTFAPEGEPYLAIEQRISWPAGTVRQDLAVALPPGVAVSGRVVDAATGRAVAGARVDYTARPATADPPADENAPRLAGFASERTGPDGRFFVAAVQRGVVRVFAARGNYLMRPADHPPDWDRELSEYAIAHAVVPLDLPPNCRQYEFQVELQPGGRLTGRVLDAAGRPAPAGVLITTGPFAHYLWTDARRFNWKDGGFAVPDADPRHRYPVVVLDADRENGAFATLPGRAGATVPDLRLQPCGRAEGRFVGRDGRPLAGVAVGLTARLSDGGSDVDWYRSIGRDESPRTDAAGRFALSGLVPGVRYRVDAFAGSSPLPTSGFTVGPGQRLSLPDAMLPRRD